MGRLLLAAAVVVSVAGIAQSAGASGGGFSCSGSGGSVTATPGLLLSTGKPQTITGTQNGLSCTGGFVTSGNLTFSVQTPSAERCSGMIGTTSRGTGKLVWTNPAGMGKSTLKFNLTITSTSGHVTNGTISGLVTTTGSNLAAGKTVAGSITLNKGLRSVASGGDCTVTIPLTSFGISAISIHT